MPGEILGNQSYMSTLGVSERAWMGAAPQMLAPVTVTADRVNWKMILLVVALIVWVIVGRGSNRRRR